MCCSVKADTGFSSTFRDRTDCRLSEININVVTNHFHSHKRDNNNIKRVSTDEKPLQFACSRQKIDIAIFNQIEKIIIYEVTIYING